LLGDLAAFLLAAASTPAQLWGQPWAQHVGLLAATVLTLAVAGLYRSRLSLSALDDLPRLVGAVVTGTAVGTLLLVVTTSTAGEGDVLWHGALFAALLVGSRTIAYAVVRTARRRGLVGHRTLVLGAGRVGARLGAAMRSHPKFGLRPVGFLDSDPLVPVEELAVPLLGGYDDLARTIRQHRVSEVIVAFGGMRESMLVDVLRTCDRLQCEIFVVPRLFELHHRSRDVDEVWGLPLVRVRRPTWRNWSWRLKRVFDIVVSAAFLVVLAPLLAVIALAVRLECGPRILFTQVRVGLDSQPFTLLKFRSLTPVDDVESSTRWTVSRDVRIGPVGRFLRATSLDELPQLLNVLRGQMSIVGPRPERPHFVADFTTSIPRYLARHRTPAGLTGWAQVHGLRGDTSIEDRASFDNYYIENWSLWLDVKILLRTVATMVLRRGA
jgi:exopolysaccharide biosynthesis polyprenyl glycosylphosphotransferase